ncbi:MAG: phosphopantetheine-binding protein, partial [Terriglobia bacterium]
VEVFLKRRLDAYERPIAVFIDDRLPLILVGARLSLLLPHRPKQRPVADARESPKSTTEQTIARIWERILGVTRVSRNQSFFDLGGHSILLLRVHRLLVDEMKCEIRPIDLFAHPTIRLLALRLEEIVNKSQSNEFEEARPNYLSPGDRQARLRRRSELLRSHSAVGGGSDD